MTTLTHTITPERPEHLFTVEDYLRMVEVGILTKNDKVELIAGRIVEKMPGNPPHEASLQRVHALLMKACTPDWMVRAESPIQLENSAPEPDVMIIRGPIERFDHQHPRAADALVVVEISDSTLRDDCSDKLRIYAAAGIPTYWIVNLIDRRLEQYTDPTGPENLPTYKSRHDFDESQSIALLFPDDNSADLRIIDMLPSPNP